MKAGDLVKRDKWIGVVIYNDDGYVKVLWNDGMIDYNHFKNLEVI
jgi:hypothetical protein